MQIELVHGTLWSGPVQVLTIPVCDFVGGESLLIFEENCVNEMLYQEMVKNMDKVIIVFIVSYI